MKISIRLRYFTKLLCMLSLMLHNSGLKAENRRLVWSDEFNGTSIDRNIWSFETGSTYETLHYFTDRLENAKIADGKLQIIACRESYQGFDYTAALIRTQNIFYWRYGRIEARIKLPHTTGFVPGFWMLPQDDRYGYWPWGGEIDVMEHPTNQDRIFGTCHTWKYSYFSGTLSPAGGSIQTVDSETEFHIYAVEWTPDKIDFFVDDQKYYTFNNEHSGFEAWPFDQPFYVILAMGVGGGWVGNPDATTVFPGMMEVDYVRVYQNTGDLVVCGKDYVLSNSKGVVYSIPGTEDASYRWSLPNGSAVISGENTHQIAVDWGIFGGNIAVDINDGEGSYVIEYPVFVSSNLIKNAGFEKGVKYWNKTGPYPAEAVFALTAENVSDGDYCMTVDVKTPGVNAWDAQLSQGNLFLKSGGSYHASFWAKKDGAPAQLNPAIVNSVNYTVYAMQSVTLTDTWQKFDLSFNAPENATASFNFGMGGQTGKFYYDDFLLAETEIQNVNQIVNADFSEGDTGWIFNTFWPAQANAAVLTGELAVSIQNGGVNPWDVYVGQSGVSVEKGMEYTVSFDAYASAPRDISTFVGKNADPWNTYSGSNTISVTDRRRTYTYSFVMNDPTDNQGRLGFDIGGSSEDFFLDNVFLSRETGSSDNAKRVDVSPRSFQLYQNIPNPFNPGTVIQFELPGDAYVKLDIFDITGKWIESLLDTRLQAGFHSVLWNGGRHASGIYFYRISTDNASHVKKMFLIR
jgi:beta-glucanase (GH16 family)